MSDDEKFEQFMQRVMQRPLPIDGMERIEIFAKELARGASEGIWATRILTIYRHSNQNPSTGSYRPVDSPIKEYLAARWDNDYPQLTLLSSNDYLIRHDNIFELTSLAFQLLKEKDSAPIFISYVRQESSAFALLIRSRLKEFGISDAFIDMTIPAGADWEKRIQDEIGKCDYFILLLGKESLSSRVLCKEILWTLNAKRQIIPVWHNEYSHKKGWTTQDTEVLAIDGEASLKIDEVASRLNAIRVVEESASGYEKAIIELLSHFGITS